MEYWQEKPLGIPLGKSAGNYSANINIKAVKTGESP